MHDGLQNHWVGKTKRFEHKCCSIRISDITCREEQTKYDLYLCSVTANSWKELQTMRRMN